MLDTKARLYIQPIFEKTADFCVKKSITANQVTVLALIIGLIASVMLYFDLNILAVVILWISGYFDALDGTIARKTNTKSKIGGFMDIVFDRIIEISIIIVLSLKTESLAIYSVFLLSGIILSMTVFLTSGALIEKDSKKAFYYQTGLAERTEGFIMLSLAMAIPKYVELFIIFFTCIVIFTAVQRFIETIKYLKN